MYDNKSVNTRLIIEHMGKIIYFRDVNFFIERVKKITLVKPVDLIRTNLWMNLGNIVFEWWSTELSDTEKKNNKIRRKG